MLASLFLFHSFGRLIEGCRDCAIAMPTVPPLTWTQQNTFFPNREMFNPDIVRFLQILAGSQNTSFLGRQAP